MDSPGVGFAVIYRWRIRSGMEDQFQQAWATITKSFIETRNALGSRLHKAADGSWIAYAQWPTRQAWDKSRELGPSDPGAAALMVEADEESFEPTLLHPVNDYLISD